MDALGKRLVRALIEEGKPAILTKAGVSDADLFDDGKDSYDWAYGFFTKNREWPTGKQVKENTGIELPDKADDLEYVCELIRKRTLGKGIEKDLKPALKQLEDRDPDEALRLIGEITLNHRTGKGKQTRSFRDDGPTRYEEYQENQRAGLPGVQTPWRRLDQEIQCWVDGSLNVVVAMQNTGKTWSCCLFANHALSLGKKVLFVSLEMSNVRIERRVDAMHYKIPFGDLRDADMEMFEEFKWRDSIKENTKGKGDIIYADKQLVRYVSDVNALVLEHDPDLVVIDGGYRFSAKGVKGDWENAKQIVADLQTTAEATMKPWIVTTQQGEVSTNKKMESSERAFKVKYAKEWVINPDIVIEMYCNSDMRLMKQMEWILLKDRDAKEGQNRDPFRTNWDLDNMDFTQLNTADDFSGGGPSAVSF